MIMKSAKSMRILLVNPHDVPHVNDRSAKSITESRGLVPPLGIAYIAAVLEKEGYPVKIIDCKALGLSSEGTKQLLLKEKADIVGVTAMTPTIHGVLETARHAKEAGSLTIIGGAHIMALPNETMSYDFVDFGINGEGEYVMLNLVKALESKKDYSDIEGLIYKDKKTGKAVINKPAIVKNLDELPFPARHLLPNHKYSCVIARRAIQPVLTSRGCPYQCGFCSKLPSDTLCRQRDPKLVVDEIEECIRRFGAEEIMITDDTFTLKRDHAVAVCNEMISRGLKIPWQTPTRVNHVDLELLKLMKKAGCRIIRYGVESGNDEVLKTMRKGITKDQVRKAFRWTKEAGIDTFAFFIIGYIGETPETITETINFAKELDPTWVMFLLATPFPQTNLFDLASGQGLVDPNYWAEYTLGKRNDRIPYLVPEADKWMAKAYRSYYIRPKFVIKALKKMRSADTIKKYITGAKGIVFFKMHD